VPGSAFLDLDVQFSRSGTDYQAQIIRSPAGDGQSVTFSWPFSELELENFLLKMGRARGTTRRIEAAPIAAAKQAGGRLFDAVFAGAVGECMRRSRDRADESEATLRIRLRLSECPELANLPWELLYDRGEDWFLALSGGTPVVRYVQLPVQPRAVPVALPLRILVIRSEPTDCPSLNLAAEWAHVADALAELSDAGLVEFTELAVPTLGELRRALLRDTFHVLHYMGHGAFDEQHGGSLMFTRPSGRGEEVTGGDLGVMLHDHRSMRLAVLNACQAGRTDPEDPFAGVADTLVRRGIPAVIAMQFAVSDAAAIEFAPALYGALATGRPIDMAVAEARKAVYTVSRVEWATPVLYLRADNARLFDVSEVPSSASHVPSRHDGRTDPRPSGRAPSVAEISSPPASAELPPSTAIPGPAEKKLRQASLNDRRWLRHFVEEQIRVHGAEVIAGPEHLKYLRLTLRGDRRALTYCYVATRGYVDFRLPKSSARNRQHAFARDLKDDGAYAVRLRLNSEEAMAEALQLSAEAAQAALAPAGQHAPADSSADPGAPDAVEEDLPGVENLERRLAVMRRFNVPADQGLDRAQASQAFLENGYNPRSFGGWVRRGWIDRDGDRRYLTDKGRQWIAELEVLHGSDLHVPPAPAAASAVQVEHGPAGSGTPGVARQANVRVPTSAEFRTAMAGTSASQRELLERACDWAEALEREGLATLVTSRGSHGAVSNLTPLLAGQKVSFVRIYLDGRLMLARSVYESWAPRSLPAVEAALGAKLTQGSSTRILSDDLRDALTAAYEEAAHLIKGWLPES
jgi:hypothetical protein